MYIVVVGAGEVGAYLARILVEDNHDVAVIEINDKLARTLDSSLDALVVQGSGISRETLLRAGIRRADMFIAATRVDEVNLIACMTAAKFGKNPVTVARVRHTEYLRGDGALSAKELGVSLLVGPEKAVATQVVDLLSYEGAGEMRPLANNRLVLLELPLSADSPLVHESLAELRDVFPTPSLVAGVLCDDGFRIPRGDTRLAAHERVEVLTTPENAGEWVILSGKPWHHVRHVLILGCGTIGFHVARELESQKLYSTIIEADLERAEWASKQLPKSIVLHGDGTDPQTLRTQLEEACDAVVVLIDDAEKAVLVGLFAKHLGAKKVIVRSDKLDYAPIANKMGIDAMISPTRAVANSILSFVRSDSDSAQMLGDHEGELVKYTIPEKPRNAALTTKSLRELEFPEGSLVGAVIRGDDASIADGSTILNPGDELLVFSLPATIPSLDKFLR